MAAELGTVASLLHECENGAICGDASSALPLLQDDGDDSERKFIFYRDVVKFQIFSPSFSAIPLSLPPFFPLFSPLVISQA